MPHAKLPTPSQDDLNAAVREAIDTVDAELREVSLSIHSHPELAWNEHHAHDVLTEYMSRQRGFVVTKHAYDLPTAWTAVFTSSAPSNDDKLPVVGFNSEMDALKGIGHACGHNLIAIAGCAAAIGVARTLERFQLPGKVVLLGTPAEEAGGGKVVLLQRGAYDEFDACLMVHPGPGGGGKHGAGIMTSSCVAGLTFTYHGASAHAGGAPEKGRNALDAAVLAYQNVSALRQQLPKDAKVHGIITGCENWSANVVPGEAKLLYGIRSPSASDLAALIPRVLRCFAGAALAANCTYTLASEILYLDVRPSPGLAQAFKEFAEKEYGGEGYEVPEHCPTGGSTDFGNVSYRCPSLHPMFYLPDAAGDEHPHSDSYTAAVATPSAHLATLRAASALASSGLRVLTSPSFRAQIRREWEEDMRLAQGEKAVRAIERLVPSVEVGPGGQEVREGRFCDYCVCGCEK
ncbi:Peptidase M20 domain-containing protein 2 [Rhodotorula toruloides]|nr:Peptidase M20 domain-containing protein 2 [Rhodotorula toruloides]